MQFGMWTIPLLPAVAVGMAVVLAGLVLWGVHRVRRSSGAPTQPAPDDRAEPGERDWTGEAASGAADPPRPARPLTVADAVAARDADTQPMAAVTAATTATARGAGPVPDATGARLAGPTPPRPGAPPSADAGANRLARAGLHRAATDELGTPPVDARRPDDPRPTGGWVPRHAFAEGSAEHAPAGDGPVELDGDGGPDVELAAAVDGATSTSARGASPGAPVAGDEVGRSGAEGAVSGFGEGPVENGSPDESFAADVSPDEPVVGNEVDPAGGADGPRRVSGPSGSDAPVQAASAWSAFGAPQPAGTPQPDATPRDDAALQYDGARDTTTPAPGGPPTPPSTAGPVDPPEDDVTARQDGRGADDPSARPGAEDASSDRSDDPGDGVVPDLDEDADGPESVGTGPLPPPWSPARTAPATESVEGSGSAEQMSFAVQQALAARAVQRARGRPDVPDLSDDVPVSLPDARDRLLSVLLTDPVAALCATTDLDDTRARIDRLGDVLRRRRADMATAVHRLHASGLTGDQIGHLAGLDADDVREILEEPSGEGSGGR